MGSRGGDHDFETCLNNKICAEATIVSYMNVSVFSANDLLFLFQFTDRILCLLFACFMKCCVCFLFFSDLTASNLSLSLSLSLNLLPRYVLRVSLLTLQGPHSHTSLLLSCPNVQRELILVLAFLFHLPFHSHFNVYFFPPVTSNQNRLLVPKKSSLCRILKDTDSFLLFLSRSRLT